MIEKVSIPSVANQFMRVEGELSTLKGLAQQFADHLTQAVGKESDGSLILTMRGFHVTIHELELRWGPAGDEPTETEKPAEPPAQEMPEMGARIAPIPNAAPMQHFDGHHWRPGPTPENNVEGLDVPPGRGLDMGQG